MAPALSAFRDTRIQGNVAVSNLHFFITSLLLLFDLARCVAVKWRKRAERKGIKYGPEFNISLFVLAQIVDDERISLCALVVWMCARALFIY